MTNLAHSIMDSLTQIILGAACGEAVLGKKIGNKALVFGAIGGTIPDLDVFIGPLLYDNEIQAMAFHRGFMHSILFSVIGALALVWLSFKLYNKGKRFGSSTLKDWMLLFFWSLFTHPTFRLFYALWDAIVLSIFRLSCSFQYYFCSRSSLYSAFFNLFDCYTIF
jgi:membrane-bound metal-dependent hydrolase YbcI (DUF457 family)